MPTHALESENNLKNQEITSMMSQIRLFFSERHKQTVAQATTSGSSVEYLSDEEEDNGEKLVPSSVSSPY